MRIMPFTFDRKKQNAFGVCEITAINQQRLHRTIIADELLCSAENAGCIGDGVGQRLLWKNEVTLLD